MPSTVVTATLIQPAHTITRARRIDAPVREHRDQEHDAADEERERGEHRGAVDGVDRADGGAAALVRQEARREAVGVLDRRRRADLERERALDRVGVGRDRRAT